MGGHWSFAAAAAALFASATAQTGTINDLGTVLQSNANLTQFYDLIQKYPSILLKLPSQSGVTILAPSNNAFAKIPYDYAPLSAAFASNDSDVITNVLEYHILQGSRIAAQLVPGTPAFIPTLLDNSNYTNVTGGQRIENIKQSGDVVVMVSGRGTRSTVVEKDLQFNGGYIQVIDSLMIPPTNLSDTTTQFSFLAFQGAAYDAKRIEAYTNNPNLTFFIPNDEAFQALGTAITNMTTDELASVLDYHVVPDLVYSPSLTNGTQFVTQNGQKITIRQSGNNRFVNSAQLLQSDILIANGVIHLIDNVLNPQGPGASPNPDATSQAPAFASATQANDVPFTSNIPCTESCPVTSTSISSPAGTGLAATSTTGVKSTSSKGAAAARETGFGGAVGLMAALGGAVLMI